MYAVDVTELPWTTTWIGGIVFAFPPPPFWIEQIQQTVP